MDNLVQYDFLDTTWIENGLVKRKSNYSPVVCFETTDPKRLLQLKEYILTHPEVKNADAFFIYDQWEGLGRLGLSPSGPVHELYRKRPTGGSSMIQRARGDEGVELQNFKAVLKEVDGYLKNQRTVFVIQNISEVREWETGLQSALRAWAIDPQIITRNSTIFILTADAASLLDAFTRELVVIISVDPSSAAERHSLIELIAKELGLELPRQATIELEVTTAGLNLHQVESILLESYNRRRTFDMSLVKDLKSELVKRSGILEVSEPTASFADIGGYQAIKDFTVKYIINVLRYSERARRFGLPLPKGILFFGPPGTGKSLFAKALATEIQLPFINLVTENIYSKWLGESGQNMKNAIQLAEKMSPAIVFVDEIDRFGKRTSTESGSAGEETKRVFSQFLEWLGRPEREAIIVGTTNVPEHLDEAFTRTGRFDYKIPFLYPGPRARLDVLLVHLGLNQGTKKVAVPLDMSREELVQFLEQEILDLTKNFSCAELEELVTRAKRVAFDRGGEGLGRDDFLNAARSFRIDVQHRREVISECLAQARRFTDDQTFLDAVEREMEVRRN
ncbi:MAG: ATP-binding protein [Bacillota bacterium]